MNATRIRRQWATFLGTALSASFAAVLGASLGAPTRSAATVLPPGSATATPQPSRPLTTARERRLHLAGAEASSYLVNDWNKFQENYLPLYVGDDDPKTAWTLKTEGIGEWLRLHVTPMTGATRVRLKIRNGYQKSAKLFAANSRAQGLTVVLLPSNKTVEVELTDTSDWQEIAVEQPSGPLESLELRVRSVYHGKKYDDLCLSDVQVFVTATTPDNPAYEKQRLEKIASWKVERLAAAKLFSTQLGQSLPLAARYEISDGGATFATHYQPYDCKDELCYIKHEIAHAEGGAKDERSRAAWKIATELSKKDFAGLPAARISTRDKRKVPAADGVCVRSLNACTEDPCFEGLPLPAELGYLDAESLVLTEQTSLPSLADVLNLKAPVCKQGRESTFAYVARDPAPAQGVAGAAAGPGAVRAIVLATCGPVYGREGTYPAADGYVLVYGPDGTLDFFGGAHRTSFLRWEKQAATKKLIGARVDGKDLKDPIVFVASASPPPASP